RLPRRAELPPLLPDDPRRADPPRRRLLALASAPPLRRRAHRLRATPHPLRLRQGSRARQLGGLQPGSLRRSERPRAALGLALREPAVRPLPLPRLRGLLRHRHRARARARLRGRRELPLAVRAAQPRRVLARVAHEPLGLVPPLHLPAGAGALAPAGAR